MNNDTRSGLYDSVLCLANDVCKYHDHVRILQVKEKTNNSRYYELELIKTIAKTNN